MNNFNDLNTLARNYHNVLVNVLELLKENKDVFMSSIGEYTTDLSDYEGIESFITLYAEDYDEIFSDMSLNELVDYISSEFSYE